MLDIFLIDAASKQFPTKGPQSQSFSPLLFVKLVLFMLVFRLIILKYFSLALYVNAVNQSGMLVWQLCYVYEISNLQLTIVLIKPFSYKLCTESVKR